MHGGLLCAARRLTQRYCVCSCERNVTLDPKQWRLLRPDAWLVEDPTPVRAAIVAQLPSYLVRAEDIAFFLSPVTPAPSTRVDGSQAKGDPWDEAAPHTSLTNLLLQLHSLERATSLWDGASYDAIIYARPDMWFFNDLNTTQLAAAAQQVWSELPGTHDGH